MGIVTQGTTALKVRPPKPPLMVQLEISVQRATTVLLEVVPPLLAPLELIDQLSKAFKNQIVLIVMLADIATL